MEGTCCRIASFLRATMYSRGQQPPACAPGLTPGGPGASLQAALPHKHPPGPERLFRPAAAAGQLFCPPSHGGVIVTFSATRLRRYHRGFFAQPAPVAASSLAATGGFFGQVSQGTAVAGWGIIRGGGGTGRVGVGSAGARSGVGSGQGRSDPPAVQGPSKPPPGSKWLLTPDVQ